jgi:heme exporter protein A
VELALENLGKRFGGRRVFQGVTASISDGQCLVITGRNGSGKSTLLAVIAGLLSPSAGRVRLRDRSRELDDAERRDALGMVAPALALYAELTALENLEFFARLRGLPARRPELEALLQRVGLASRGRDRLGEFSSGMQVRLKYACALLHSPRVLLLDEPTANLDADGTALVEEIVREHRGRGLAVIATNEPEERRFADREIRLG